MARGFSGVNRPQTVSSRSPAVPRPACRATRVRVVRYPVCRAAVSPAQGHGALVRAAQYGQREGRGHGGRGTASRSPAQRQLTLVSGSGSHERQAQHRSYRRGLHVVPGHPEGAHQASRHLPAEPRVPVRHRRRAPGAHRRVRQGPVRRGGARRRIHLHHRQGRRLHRYRLRPVPDPHRWLRDAQQGREDPPVHGYHRPGDGRSRRHGVRHALHARHG